MKLLKNNRRIDVGFFLLLVLGFSMANSKVNAELARGNQTENSSQSIDEVVDTIAAFQLIKWQNDPNSIKKKLPEIYSKLSIQYFPIIENCLDLYKFQVLIDIGKRKEALDFIKDNIYNSLDKPILLPYLADPNNLEKRVEVWNELGQILPLSLWGYDRDSRLSPKVLIKIHEKPPQIPDIRISITTNNEDTNLSMMPGKYKIQDVLKTIGDLYYHAGFLDDALNVYLESFYSIPNSDNARLNGEIWLKIAEIETIRGDKQLAVKGYLNSVYSWHEYAEQVKKGINEVLSNSDPDKEFTNEQLKLKKDIAIQIATLYQKLNLHPIALNVLEKSEKDTGDDLSEEKKLILKEWNETLEKLRDYYRLVSMSEQGKFDFYVLGQKVSEVKDWAKIKILRPTDTFWKIQE